MLITPRKTIYLMPAPSVLMQHFSGQRGRLWRTKGSIGQRGNTASCGQSLQRNLLKIEVDILLIVERANDIFIETGYDIAAVVYAKSRLQHTTTEVETGYNKELVPQN